MFHRHIYLGPESPDFPRQAQFADNGYRFKAAEGLDFNSLYERVLFRIFYSEIQQHIFIAIVILNKNAVSRMYLKKIYHWDLVYHFQSKEIDSR